MQLVFLHQHKSYDANQLDNPKHFEVIGAKHHYLSIDNDEHIGVWTIPAAGAEEVENCNKIFCNSKTTILYLHGQTGHRGQPNYRVEFYNLVTHLGFNVVTFDYRGFGDSVPTKDIPSINRTVEDTDFVYQWILDNHINKGNSKDGKREIKNNIIIFGHSLGSAVAVHFLSRLPADSGTSLSPCGLILMSPFNNVHDEISHHMWTRPWSILMPRFLFSWFFDPKKEVRFVPDALIQSINVPILILHSHGDTVIDIDLARKLFASRSQSSHIKFVELLKSFGHSDLFKAEEFSNELNKISENC